MSKLVRVMLIGLGLLVAGLALAFWIWLNGMASAYGNQPMRMEWVSGEAALFFWLPFAIGLGGAVLAWRSGR